MWISSLIPSRSAQRSDIPAMKKRSKTLTLFGILFLVIGLLWLAAIFIRCQGCLPKKTTYPQVYRSAVKQYQRLTARLGPLSVKQYMPKAFIIHFWMIGCWELFCSLFYILSGIFVLRLYPFGRRFVLWTLLADLLLKGLIVSYQQFILVPLQAVFQKTNVMFTYFAPNASLNSQVSSYLTGIKLVQPHALYYAAVYGFYLLIVFFVFTRARVKNQFVQS